MTLILQLMQLAGKTSTVLEDAFLVVGSLASGKNWNEEILRKTEKELLI
jgi:importin subunit beta-1